MVADTSRHLHEQGLSPDRLLEHALNSAFTLSFREEATVRDRTPRDRPYPIVARPPDTPGALGAGRRCGDEHSGGGEQADDAVCHSPASAGLRLLNEGQPNPEPGAAER